MKHGWFVSNYFLLDKAAVHKQIMALRIPMSLSIGFSMVVSTCKGNRTCIAVYSKKSNTLVLPLRNVMLAPKAEALEVFSH